MVAGMQHWNAGGSGRCQWEGGWMRWSVIRSLGVGRGQDVMGRGDSRSLGDNIGLQVGMIAGTQYWGVGTQC